LLAVDLVDLEDVEDPRDALSEDEEFT